jgi:GH15 family glucan-1,4-alpha-glucosidase
VTDSATAPLVRKLPAVGSGPSLVPTAEPPARGGYPPIADYGLIGDCHTAALVSRAGSIDWACLPYLHSASVFARLLDWNLGGYCTISPTGDSYKVTRRYLDRTLVLETTFTTPSGTVRLTDCFPMHEGGGRHPYREIMRVVDGVEGVVALRALVAPRFDYGELAPWVRAHGPGIFSAIGGDHGLLVASDLPLARRQHTLSGEISLRAGQRRRLALTFLRPHDLDSEPPPTSRPAAADRGWADERDRRLVATIAWWRHWSAQARPRRLAGADGQQLLRSAIVLKALTNPRTGAIAAAPTAALPEHIGGERNWDYRFSWLRDAVLTLHALQPLGFTREAEGFVRFVERSAAGRGDDLQILYGIHGERRLPEQTLDHLEGYRGSAPVRIGNAASRQLQLDVYGELMQVAWHLGARGRPEGGALRSLPCDQDDQDARWAFLVSVVEAAATRWTEPDSGIWELRGAPRHLVHSKVACWAALDRGLRLATRTGRPAPLRRWRRVRDQIGTAVEQHGYDRRRGVFTHAFGVDELDAALLQLPALGFVDWCDARMLRTTDAIAAELGRDGLVRRYLADDGIAGGEGAFLACTFWLAECLARQGRLDQARTWFAQAVATANDLGLFAEQVDPQDGELLGNFPQGFSHLAHLSAAVALQRATAVANHHDAMQQPAREGDPGASGTETTEEADQDPIVDPSRRQERHQARAAGVGQ